MIIDNNYYYWQTVFLPVGSRFFKKVISQLYGRCWGIGRTFESYPTTPSKLAAALSIYKPFLPVFLQAIFDIKTP